MSLLRWMMAGVAGFAAYKIVANQGVKANGAQEPRRHFDGLSATFQTREQAELAQEHLVQEYGVDPSFVYIEPTEAENSSGNEISGGDHASGRPGHGDRADAPLRGAIELTVPATAANEAKLRRALEEVGGSEVRTF